jgi:hypothetical protein
MAAMAAKAVIMRNFARRCAAASDTCYLHLAATALRAHVAL